MGLKRGGNLLPQSALRPLHKLKFSTMADGIAKDFSNEIDDLEKHFRDIFASIGSQLKVLVSRFLVRYSI
jgi:hypothetical protein